MALQRNSDKTGRGIAGSAEWEGQRSYTIAFLSSPPHARIMRKRLLTGFSHLFRFDGSGRRTHRRLALFLIYIPHFSWHDETFVVVIAVVFHPAALLLDTALLASLPLEDMLDGALSAVDLCLGDVTVSRA